MIDVVVLGAGASGYAAAIEAASLGAKVVLVEGAKPCRKVLASGNGRCNLTAKGVDVGCYLTHEPTILAAVLRQSSAVDEFLSRVGIEVQYDASGRGYPRSHRAQSVAEALQLHAAHVGVRVQGEFAVSELRPIDGGWRVLSQTGESLSARRVVVALGSPAAPQLGGTGMGLTLAEGLGLHVYPTAPALVPLRVRHPVASLKGCRVECDVHLVGDGFRRVEHGEVLFADYGLSGIAVMQMSAYLEQGQTILLDLLPDRTEDEVYGMLVARQANGAYPTVDKWLVGILDRAVAFAVLKQGGISPLDLPTAKVSSKDIRRLATTLKAWPFAVTGPLGPEYAQVCSGGVDLAELHDWQATKAPRVYWCGEVLDVTGQCGGYNLHWAWLSGILAGQHAATD